MESVYLIFKMRLASTLGYTVLTFRLPCMEPRLGLSDPRGSLQIRKVILIFSFSSKSSRLPNRFLIGFWNT